MTSIPILCQNNDFIAVNKAPGISVHNKEDPENLLSLLAKQLNSDRLFPVHRLDKETSGIQVIALNSDSARRLADEFQNRSVQKVYTGVLRGQLSMQSGVWTRSLTDKAEGRKNPAGMAGDRISCETKFKVVKSSKYFSLCEFDLITGRQHQIRKHSALANHALVGDSRYGDKKYNDKIATLYSSSRMYLHCTRLEIMNQILSCPTPVSFAQLIDGVR